MVHHHHSLMNEKKGSSLWERQQDKREIGKIMCLQLIGDHLKGFALELTERGFIPWFPSLTCYTPKALVIFYKRERICPPRGHLRDAETPQAREFVNSTEASATMMALPAW